MNLSGFTGTSRSPPLGGTTLVADFTPCRRPLGEPCPNSSDCVYFQTMRVPHPRLVRVGLSFRVPHSGWPRLVTNGLLRWTPLRPVTGVELTYAEFAPTPWVGARVSQSSETKGPTLTRRGWGTPKDQALAPVSTPCVIPPWRGR